MKYIKFLLVFGFTVFTAYFLDHKIPIGEKPTPPLGKILNPFLGLWQNGEGSEFDDQTLNHPSLKEDVTIIYDARKVPHIYAQNLEDALFAQGYVEAADRLFQMDFSTKATEGRLSEILGKKMIDFDKERRRFGLAYAAENAVKSWNKFPDKIASLQTYVEGVNAYISSLSPKDHPIEHKLIGDKPEQWSIYRSALFFKSMAEVLCSNEKDVRNTNTLKFLGEEEFDYLFPEINAKESPIIPKGTKWEFDPIQIKPNAETELSYIKDLRDQRPNEGVGSNNWAVDGSKTASGYPILCNDPHLNLTLPSIWYEIHIHTPEFNAYGVSLPGMPGVMIGFNDNIAWGETNVGHDVLDWLEIEWANEEKTKYMLDGKETNIEYRVEKIKTKEGNTVLDSVKYTVWGPLSHHHVKNDYTDLAMHWLSHSGTDLPEFMTFVELMQAKNYDGYAKALESYVSPAQNFAFAAKDGDIAIHVNGILPAKAKGHGRFVQKGNISESGWDTFIPREQIPKVLNPERGFISSANQRSADVDYPYYYTGGFEDYRGRSVNQNLAEMENIVVDDMKKLQWNSHNIKAQEFTPIMLSMLSSDRKEKYSTEVNELESWDFFFKQESKAATIFEIWYTQFYKMTWDEMYSRWSEYKMMTPESWRFLEVLLDQPNSKYFDIEDTDKRENAQDVLNLSFDKAIDKLNEIKDKKGSLKWGDYRKINIGHHLEVPAFSAIDVVTDGHPSTINATNWGFGPSWRMIVELGEQPKGHGVFPGGQAGNPSSPYYKNSVEPWSKGEYYTLNAPHDPKDIKEQLFELKMGHEK